MTYDDDVHVAFSSRVFVSEMNEHLKIAQQHYDNLRYKDALVFGFYRIQESFKKYTQLSVGRLYKSLIKKYIEVQALLLAPVYPTISEYVWQILNKPTLIMYAEWPTPGPVDHAVIQASNYVSNIERMLQKKLSSLLFQSKSVAKPTTCRIHVARSFSTWQKAVIQFLSSTPNQNIDETKQFCSELYKQPELEKYAIQIKPFLKNLEEVILWLGIDVKSNDLPFDEKQVLLENVLYLSNALKIERLEIEYFGEDSEEDCFPGYPRIKFLI